MRGNGVATVLLAVLVLNGAACRHDGPAIVATFDVQQLPPEPPAPPRIERVIAPGDTDKAPGALLEPPPTPDDPLIRPNELMSPILFDTDRWEMSDDALKAIAADADVMKGATDWIATVEGHADERGSEAYDHVLGIWRAKAVKDRLRSLGLDPDRMTILSHGKSKPAVAGKDSASLARNRRVEIVLHPHAGAHTF